MLLSDAWLEEFQQCIIRKHNTVIHPGTWSQHPFVSGFCFFSGTHCIVLQSLTLNGSIHVKSTNCQTSCHPTPSIFFKLAPNIPQNIWQTTVRYFAPRPNGCQDMALPSNQCAVKEMSLNESKSFDPPPLRNPRLPRDRRRSRRAFSWLFVSSLTHLLIPSLRKSGHRSRGHMTFCTRTSAQNLPKICILHIFVYKTHGNYWLS